MKNEVVLISGASSGIGAELAKEYAKRGYHLVLAARRIERLKKLQQEIRFSYPEVSVVVQACDVTVAEDVEKLTALARREFGRIDIVVANAGYGQMGTVETLKIQDYKNQFETNVVGVVQTVKAALEDLKKSRGQVVIVGSGMSYVSLPATSAYSMSKFAVKAFADCLRYEVRKNGVGVTLICPGTVATEFAQVSLGRELHEADPGIKYLTMSARQAAREAVRGAEHRRSEVHITRHSRIGVWTQRHFPWLVQSVISCSTERLVKTMG